MPAHTASRAGSGSHSAESMVAVSLASLAAGEVGDGGASGASNRRPCSVQGSTLREHFHLPLHTVAHKFGMCTTAFKKMCRRLGIAKWPHRQLRGIDKKIAALKAELTYASTGDRAQFLSGLTSLEEEKSRLANGLLGEGTPLCYTPLASAQNDMEDDNDAPTPPASAARGDVAPAGNDSEDAEESFEDEESGEGSGEGAFGPNNGAGMVITEAELRSNFHLPLHTAARKFGICTTAFKKLCRRFGIAKWPHRQLRGIDKKIAALTAELNYTTGDRQGCRKSLQSLQEEKARLSSPGAALDAPAKRRGEAATGKKGAAKHSSEEHSEIETDEEPMHEDEEEPAPALPCSSSALDLLAAVAGVKEEHDRVEEEKTKALSGLATCVATALAANAQAAADPFDTPPMEPVDTTGAASMQQAHVKMCMSPMLGSLTKVSQEHSGMVPMGSSTPLIGLSWTGETCSQAVPMSLDQCA